MPRSAHVEEVSIVSGSMCCIFGLVCVQRFSLLLRPQTRSDQFRPAIASLRGQNYHASSVRCATREENFLDLYRP